MPHRFTYRGRRLAGEGPGELTVHLGPRKRRRGPGGRRRRNLFQEGREGHRASVITDGTCRPCRIGEDMHCENLVFPGITADGGFAEVLRTSERSLVRIHDLAPDDVAPLADAGLTAIRAVKKAASRTTSGSNVVVMGVGGLGHIALQLLRCMTNALIIAADVAESKLRLAEKMGAHRVIDARRDPVKQVMDITGK